MKSLLIIAFAITYSLSAHSIATMSFTYTDGAAEGFNDSGAALAASTAPGATIGAQRKASFEAAVNAWGSFITSTQTIVVSTAMDPLTCNASSGILGSAGPTNVHKNTAGAVANTWYPTALANKLSSSDNNGAGSDISSTFNSDIDGNNSCLNLTDWFYATSKGAGPAGTISFYDTVLHEVAHGLGFISFVDVTTGELFGAGFGIPDPAIDIVSTFLEDHSTTKLWGAMTDGERLISITDTGDLHWTGTAVTTAFPGVPLTAGTSGGHVQMYAPSPVEQGSSVSHWDTAVKAGTRDELMEPFSTITQEIMITDELFEDIGWGSTLPVELQSFEIE